MKKTNPTIDEIIKNPELYKEEANMLNKSANKFSKSINNMKNQFSNFNIKSKDYDKCKSILKELGREFTNEELSMSVKELVIELERELREKKLNDLGL